MEHKFNIYLATPSERITDAMGLGYPLAYMAYRIGHGFHLYRSPAPVTMRGGIMVIDDKNFTGHGSCQALSGEIIRECIARKYSGIFLNVRSETSLMRELASVLDAACAKNDLSLFVPPSLSPFTKNAHILIGSAVSGGTLEGRIREAQEQYAPNNIALDIERTRMDFALPARSGTGKAITREELQSLLHRFRAQPFFSKELCAFYFTYRRDGVAHFVLFDNAASIMRKITLAGRLGIRSAFLCFSDIADIAEDLRKK